MNSGYVLAGYGITIGSLGLYALRVVRRGRVLSRSLPGDVPLAGPDSSSPVPAATTTQAATPAPAPAGEE